MIREVGECEILVAIEISVSLFSLSFLVPFQILFHFPSFFPLLSLSLPCKIMVLLTSFFLLFSPNIKIKGLLINAPLFHTWLSFAWLLSTRPFLLAFVRQSPLHRVRSK